METLNIENNVIENAKISTNKIEDKNLRIRAYILNIAANATMQYFSEKGLEPDTASSLYKVASFAKNFELADIYVNGFRFDVRVSFDGQYFTIPKSHKKYDVSPLAYIVVKLDEKLENIDFLGYFADEYSFDNSDDEYCHIETDLLKPMDTLSELLENSTLNIYPYSANYHEKVKELSLSFIDEEISESEKTFFIKQVIACPVCRETFCDLNDFDCVVSHIKNYQELLNDSTLSVLSGNREEIENQTIEPIEFENKQNTEEKNDFDTDLSETEEDEQVTQGNFEENFDEIDAFASAPVVQDPESDFSKEDILSQEDDEEELILFNEEEEEEEKFIENPLEDETLSAETTNLEAAEELFDMTESNNDFHNDSELILHEIEDLSAEDEEIMPLQEHDGTLETDNTDSIDTLEQTEDEEILFETHSQTESITEETEADTQDLNNEAANDTTSSKHTSFEPIELTDDEEASETETEEIIPQDDGDLMSLLTEEVQIEEQDTEQESPFYDDNITDEDSADENESEELPMVSTSLFEENEENEENNEDEESGKNIDEQHEETIHQDSSEETIETLFENEEQPSSDTAENTFELAQEPISEETVKKTKRLAVMAGLLIVLVSVGSTMLVVNKQKSAHNNVRGNEMFDFQTNTESEDVTKTPVSQDINRSMINSFSEKPTAITITKLAWQVSEKLSLEPSLKEYLQTAGKNIQMNLQNDLQNSADVAFNNLVKVSIQIAPDNTLKSLQILESSGSDEIDKTISTSIKNTLKYVSVPKLKNYKSDYFLTLIINF